MRTERQCEGKAKYIKIVYFPFYNAYCIVSLTLKKKLTISIGYQPIGQNVRHKNVQKCTWLYYWVLLLICGIIKNNCKNKRINRIHILAEWVLRK